jgi:flagellar hook-length control protein FliK
VSTSHHAAAETQERHKGVTDQIRDTSEGDQEQPTENDEATEPDETSRNHCADVMIALTVLLAGPASVNGDPQPANGEADALVVTIESASASTHITFGVMTEQPLQSQPIEPGTEQPQPAAELGNGQEESSQPIPTLISTPGVPIDAHASAAQTLSMLDASSATDRATLPSGMPADREAEPKSATSPASNQALQASDAPFDQNVGSRIEVSQQADHPGGDLMVDQRALPEWSSHGGHDEGTGQRDDQQPGGRTETFQPGRHAASREGFGDTVTAIAADRTASAQNDDSRTPASSMTGRAALMSWSNGDEGRSVVQAVSLNLEPADLGPVNVRIFMTDRTVHAHIRTDHMDLGQGMLSQQQQLETKLQSSGLEMGEFKVTVDQQQLSRGDWQGWLGHQGDRHPLEMDVVQRAAEEQRDEPAPVERRRHTGIVSLFA